MIKGLLILWLQLTWTQALSLPAWSDIFSSLAPYKDPQQPAQYVPFQSGAELSKDDLSDLDMELDDQGSPRFGIVQVRYRKVHYYICNS